MMSVKQRNVVKGVKKNHIKWSIFIYLQEKGDTFSK